MKSRLLSCCLSAAVLFVPSFPATGQGDDTHCTGIYLRAMPTNRFVQSCYPMTEFSRTFTQVLSDT